MITSGGPFWSILESHGDRTALIGGHTALSYSDLGTAADAWSNTVRALLPPTVSRPLVALELPRTCAAITAYLGCLRAGWPVILLSASDADRHTATLTTFAPNILVSGPEATPSLADGTQVTFCNDLAVLLSTSGTTGANKLVMLSAQNLCANAASIVAYLDLRPEDVTLTTLPLHYSYGMSVLHTHLMVGARLIVTDATLTDPAIWPLAREHGVTSLALVPTQFDLLQKTGFVETSLPTLRYITQAGGRLDPAVAQHFAQRAHQHGWQLFLMYGQTEAAPRMAYLPPELALRHADMIGQAIPGGRLWIEDPQGREITTPDTPGELLYEGPNVMIGYALNRSDLGKPQETKVLHTGDIAQRSNEGLFQIVGRLSRFVKLNGHRIGLDEVEATLRREGNRVLVSGDDRGIVLFVEGETGTLAADTAARYGLLNANVQARTIDQPPLLSSGKVDYGALRHMAVSALSEAPASASSSSLTAAVAAILRLPEIDPNRSFRQLGGDSLAYLEVELLLTKTRGNAPVGWEYMPLRALEARANPVAQSAWLRWQSIGTDVVIRVIAIFWVIVLHTTSIGAGGGAFALATLIGYSLARHQLPTLSDGRVLHSIDTMLRPVLLAYFVLLALLSLRIDVHWTWLALIANFPAALNVEGTSTLLQPYWFISAYVQVILLIALPFSLRPVRDWVTKNSFYAGFAATAALTFLTAVLPQNDLGANLIRLPHGMLLLAGIGWCVATASTRPRKLAVIGLACTSYLLDWRDTGVTVQEAILLPPFLLLLFPRIRLPRPVARAFLQLGALSLYIYLLHVPAIYLDTRFFDSSAGLFLSTAIVSTLGAIIARSLLRTIDRHARPFRNTFLGKFFFPLPPKASDDGRRGIGRERLRSYDP